MDFKNSETSAALGPRWHVFLRHLPYASALRHLAWAAHSAGAGLDIPYPDRAGNAGCAQRVGNTAGERNQCSRAETSRAKAETGACESDVMEFAPASSTKRRVQRTRYL